MPRLCARIIVVPLVLLALALHASATVARPATPPASAPAGEDCGEDPICFRATVSNGSDPVSCGTDTRLDIVAGDVVNYCYRVTNNTGVALNFFSLIDNAHGLLVAGAPYALAPGESYQYNRRTSVAESATSTFLWSTSDALLEYRKQSDAVADYIDMSTLGTRLDLDDDGEQTIRVSDFVLNGLRAAGFSPSLEWKVSSNGVLSAVPGAAPVDWLNTDLPSTALGFAYLPFWDDLAATTGAVYAGQIGQVPNRKYVVEWADRSHHPASPSGVSFEVVFSEQDSDVLFQYRDVDFADASLDGGRSATIGINYGSSLPRAAVHSYNSPSLQDGTAIRWSLNQPTNFTSAAQVTVHVGAPVIAITPAALSVSAGPGQQLSRTLSISNSGDRALVFDLDPVASDAHFPAQERKPSADAPSSGASIEPAPRPDAAHDKAAGAASQGPLGSVDVPAVAFDPGLADAFDLGPRLDALDATHPEDLEDLGHVAGTFLAGDFVEGDFGHLYSINLAGELWRLGTRSDREDTYVGNTGLGQPAAYIAGATYYQTNHTYYAVFSVDGHPVLYTVDLATANAVEIGTIPAGTIADIAIDKYGEMFGVDLDNDVLVAIDRDTADARMIGPIGFDANFAQDLDFDDSTDTLYHASIDASGRAAMYTLDTKTGAATLVGPIGTGTSIYLDSFAIARTSDVCAYPDSYPWLSVQGGSGSVAVGAAAVDVVVNVDTTGLEAGDYRANLCVNSNDPDRRHVVVPVALRVGSADGERLFASGFD